MFFIIVFIRQWMVTGGLLYIFSLAMKRKIIRRSLFLWSGTGSMLGIVMLLIPWRGIGFATLIFQMYFMVRKVFRVRGSQSVYYMIYFAFLTVFYGGICSFLKNQWQIPQLDLILIVSGICLCLSYQCFWERLQGQKDGRYEVSFELGGKQIDVTAFLDTGNQLYDPIGKLPVSVIEEKVITDSFGETFTKMVEKHRINGIRMIPYHCVGTENGMMTGILVHEIRIKKKNQAWNVTEGVIGLSHNKLTQSGLYEMLLHPDFIKNQEGTWC